MNAIYIVTTASWADAEDVRDCNLRECLEMLLDPMVKVATTFEGAKLMVEDMKKEAEQVDPDTPITWGELTMHQQRDPYTWTVEGKEERDETGVIIQIKRVEVGQ